MNLKSQQLEICHRFGSKPCFPNEDNIIGVAMSSLHLSEPLHGIRHPIVDKTSGWYIWRGDYKNDEDFFAPLHHSHLSEYCEEALPYLALLPGWRFLVKDEYQDVWFDENLTKKDALKS